MNGAKLWSHIEKLSRKKFGKDDTWKATMIDLKGGSAYVRLSKEGFPPILGFIEHYEDRLSAEDKAVRGGYNSWNTIYKFFGENQAIRPYLLEASFKLMDEGCYSLPIAFVATIENLLEQIEELKSTRAADKPKETFTTYAIGDTVEILDGNAYIGAKAKIIEISRLRGPICYRLDITPSKHDWWSHSQLRKVQDAEEQK